MADTIRKIIISTIKAAIENHSFTTLSGANIYLGELAFNEQYELLPIIAIEPGVEDSEQTGGNIVTNTMQLRNYSIAELNGVNPGLLGEDILGELIYSTCQTDFEGIVDIIDMRYIGGGVDQYPDNFDIPLMEVSAIFVIEYETLVGNPYAQPTS